MHKSNKANAFLAACILLIQGCTSAVLPKDPITKPTSPEPDVKHNPASEEIKKKTSIYWHLISVSDYNTSLEEATRLCVEAENFHRDLPTDKVLSSREIKIPARQTYYEDYKVTRYREEIRNGEVAYGIQLEPITIRIPYEAVETIKKEVKAVCIGAEYILDTTN